MKAIQKAIQMTYPTRYNKVGLMMAMMLALLVLSWSTAQAQDEHEKSLWGSVPCNKKQQMELYLKLYPGGAYVDKARLCLGRLAKEKRKLAELAELALRLAGKMVAIPGGSFQMGDLNNAGDDDEQPIHEVNIDSLQMGAHEVTVGQFRAFVKDSGYPASDKLNQQSEDHPVVYVSHHDAQAFIAWLNKKTRLDYRLPTEAEWEYAARAGTTTQYSWGDNESEANTYAWFGENSGDRTHSVGGKRPNPWGLYDMHGNVWEWVQDWYDADYYSDSPVNNPQGPASGGGRVFRGGGWYYYARFLRSANRDNYSPGGRSSNLGFRLVRQP